MRVATFNIRHGEATTGLVDIKLLTCTCASLDVDLLALQEVDRWMRRSRFAHLARRVAREASMAYAFGPALRNGWFGAYGNALLARGPISAVERVRLPVVSGEPRAALLACAEVRGVTISVAVTHLSVQTEERGEQLATILGALSARPAPRVLCGDLNAVPEDLVTVMAQAGFGLVPAGPTFPASAPAKQIDHVAFAGLKVVRASVPETPVSDHRPLVVELSNEAHRQHAGPFGVAPA